MAGADAGFDAAEFRTAIRFAMKMGSPPNTSDKVTFMWRPERTYAAGTPSNSPYDWTSAPVSATGTHADVTLDNVAVEFATVDDGDGTTMGRFDNSRGMLTILDRDYEQVCTANRVRYADRVYEPQEAVPQGLFEVTVWQIPLIEADER